MPSHATDGLSARARSILGENAFSRYAEFRQYPDGWDFGRGRKLCAASVTTLERFLAAEPAFPTRPSLFMTQAGSLELAWEDRRGHRVEVEFLPDRFQYFVESEGGDEEGEVELCRLPALMAHLDLEDRST